MSSDIFLVADLQFENGNIRVANMLNIIASGYNQIQAKQHFVRSFEEWITACL
jgi:hypothetical protein